MVREYEEELIKSINRPNDDDDDDDDDAEMQWVMRQSGSSNPQMNKSTSVREVGYGRGRNMSFQPTSTPASRLKAREVELEKDCKKKKTKLSTSLLKKAKKVALKAWGNL
ncbi:Glucosamine-6-phosphate deaminase [Bienertia sinuspersici]